MVVLQLVFLLICNFIIMDAKSILLYVAVGLVLAAIVVAIIWWVWLVVKARRYQHLKELYSFIKQFLKREDGDRLFCVSHHPLVLVDEKGVEIPQFHGEDELFSFSAIWENSVLPDVCYALRIALIRTESDLGQPEEFKRLLSVELAPTEYSARWRVDAVEGRNYCFVHPLMGKLKLPKVDFPELNVNETVVLKQVVKGLMWLSEQVISYQFVEK